MLACMQSWYEQHVAAPQREVKPIAATEPTPKAYALMTEDEREAAAALSTCTFLPGCFDKRFSRRMAKAENISERGRALLWRMVLRYRNQIGNRALTAKAKAKVAEMGLPEGKRI